MARIDNLLSHVASDVLRAQLSDAVAELRRQKKFGLVYEQHIPEMALLPTAGVQVGSQVLLRQAPDDNIRYFVESLVDGRATLSSTRDGEVKTEAVSELLVIKTFGQPIYPGLRLTSLVSRTDQKAYHTVINGENFHALQMLLYSYRGTVDCIYIDPPYNTGARDWKYNNDYVDSDDDWRHSKWLSFIEKRLRLARELLSPDGVLIVTIDEHEVHHLGVLLEELFPRHARQMVTIVIMPAGNSRGTGLARVEEYGFFLIPPGIALAPGNDDNLTPLTKSEVEAQEGSLDGETPEPVLESARWESLLRSGTQDARREDRQTMYYPVIVDSSSKRVLGVGEVLPKGQDPDFDLKIDGYPVAWPVRTDGSQGRWRVGRESLRKLIEDGFVKLGRYDRKRKTYPIKYLLPKRRDAIATGHLTAVEGPDGHVDYVYTSRQDRELKTVWHRSSHDAGTYGSQLLQAFLPKGVRFDFPKSLYSVRDSIGAVVRRRPNALILDFFAGSGTTLHATAMLNAEDGGDRRCILVTNNEVNESVAKELNAANLFIGDEKYELYGICRSVTMPRVRAAITGQLEDGSSITGSYLDGKPYAEGFEQNVVFFDLVYTDPDAVEIGSRFDLIAPLLWLGAGAIGTPPPGDFPSPWYLPEDAPYAVLFEEDHFKVFLVELCKREDVTHVWLVTDSDAAFARMSVRIPGSRKVGMLYRDYLRNFTVSAGGAR